MSLWKCKSTHVFVGTERHDNVFLRDVKANTAVQIGLVTFQKNQMRRSQRRADGGQIRNRRRINIVQATELNVLLDRLRKCQAFNSIIAHLAKVSFR